MLTVLTDLANLADLADLTDLTDVADLTDLALLGTPRPLADPLRPAFESHPTSVSGTVRFHFVTSVCDLGVRHRQISLCDLGGVIRTPVIGER